MSNSENYTMLENHLPTCWKLPHKKAHKNVSLTTIWFARIAVFLTAFAMATNLVQAQEATGNVNAVAPAVKLIPASKQNALASKQNALASQNKQLEDQEICRLVIKMDFQKTDNASASQLRADIKAGVFADYAISETRHKQLRKQPKISVPVGRNRYRVWYGYSKQIRNAVLTSAAAQSTASPKKVSTIAQVSYSEQMKSDEPIVDAKYPHRASWWTVAKRYPSREAMVKHLSSGQHEGTFDLTWLDALTRDELHALHSDDHENKIDWSHAVRPKEFESKPISSAN